jgi:hypothetical protein
MPNKKGIDKNIDEEMRRRFGFLGSRIEQSREELIRTAQVAVLGNSKLLKTDDCIKYLDRLLHPPSR